MTPPVVHPSFVKSALTCVEKYEAAKLHIPHNSAFSPLEQVTHPLGQGTTNA